MSPICSQYGFVLQQSLEESQSFHWEVTNANPQNQRGSRRPYVDTGAHGEFANCKNFAVRKVLRRSVFLCVVHKMWLFPDW
jgi:hypothetical protein